MRLQGVRIFRKEQEAILLTEHLIRSGVYSLYERNQNGFMLKVRVTDVDTAINLIANCPMLRDLESSRAKQSKSA